jgi:hypothetical protein
MTSFGIEWDTNLTVCDMLETDAGLVDANLTNRGAVVVLQNGLVKIQSENRNIGRYTRRRFSPARRTPRGAGGDTDGYYAWDEFAGHYGEDAEARWRAADPSGLPPAEIEGDDCLFTLEAALGPVFSPDPNTFNREGMAGLYGEFDRVWGQILADKSIGYLNGRLHVIVATSLSEHVLKELETQGGKTSADCCFSAGAPAYVTTHNVHKVPDKASPGGEREEWQKLDWAYHQLFKYVKGTPQMSVGFPLRRMAALFVNVSDLHAKYRVASERPEGIKGLKGARCVGAIATAFELFTPMRDQAMAQGENFALVLLLVLYEAVCISRRGGAYSKAQFLFKPRTNSRDMADKLLGLGGIEQLRQGLYTCCAGNAMLVPYLNSWFNPQRGCRLVIEHEMCGVTPVEDIGAPLQAIYRIPDPDSVLALSISYEELNYVTPYDGPAPELTLVAPNVPGGVERIEAPGVGHDLDIGEWYYGAGAPPGVLPSGAGGAGVALPQANYIFECRSPFTLVQLGAVGRSQWDPEWTASVKAPSVCIELGALPDLVKSNLDFYDTYAK